MKVELDQLLTRDLGSPRSGSGERSPGILGETQKFLIFDRKGIQTDLFAIERYVDEILIEVTQNKPDFLS